MKELIERLRAIAVSKENVDFSHGRKAPLYGKENEVEWQAADLLEAQAKAIEEMREALLPFAELAWAEPENAEHRWITDAENFRRAGKALASHSKGGE